MRVRTELRAQVHPCPQSSPRSAPKFTPSLASESTGLCRAGSHEQAGWEPGAPRKGRGRYGGGVSHRPPCRQPGAQKARPGRWSWGGPQWAAAAGSYLWVPGGRGQCCWGADTCWSHAGLGVRVGLIIGVAGVRTAMGKGYMCD